MTSLAPDPVELRAEDLEHLAPIHALLAVLNDPCAAAPKIAQHIEKIPALRARIVRTHRQRFPHATRARLAEQIAGLGNRHIEALLLDLLEELTVLRYEIDHRAR